MTRNRIVKTNFTSGEISPDLLGRGDLRAYDNGARTLTNVIIQPTGGVQRRPGFYFVDGVAGPARLIDFEFNTEQSYLLVLSDQNIAIYRNGVQRANVSVPWTEDQIDQVIWTQSADTLLMTHPDVAPKVLSRLSDTSWVIENWDYIEDADDGRLFQPYYKFASDASTLTPSGTSGSITFTASESVFEASHVGTRLRFRGVDAEITAFSSSTVVTATLQATLTDTDLSVDWSEQSFSAVRGYPIAVAFHQDRLVIGGSRDLPNRMWFSKSGDLFNFDLGEGLDDEAIEFAILSDQVNAIRALFSGRHLQVFTSGAEWMVTGTPLTPQTVQILRQTRIGSQTERYIPPVNVDGATLYVGRTGKELREFLYTDVEQAYTSNDLALLVRHMFDAPVDQAFDPIQRVVFLPLEDGSIAALTIYRAEKVTAWSRIITDGAFESVAVVGDHTYVLVRRTNNARRIERMDTSVFLDSALEGQVQIPTTTWSGLDHIEGETVTVIADGAIVGDHVVSSGQVTLEEAAYQVQIGLPFSHVIQPLPPNDLTINGAGRAFRMVSGIFRLIDTQAMTIDVGRGLKDVPLRNIGHSTSFDSIPEAVTQDVTIRAYGWTKDASQSLWRIEQSLPLSFTLSAVTVEMKIND